MNPLLTLSLLYFRQVWRDTAFLVTVLSGLALIVAFVLMLRGSYDAALLPATYEITDIFRRAQPLLWALLALFGGELHAREKTVKISALMDVLPYPTGLRLSARVAGLSLVLLSLLLLMLLTGLLIQTCLGFHDYNLSLYASVLLGEVLINALFMLSLAFFIHTLVYQRFLGHILIISLIVVKGYLPAWGLEHPLFHYAGVNLGRYSDLHGFARNELLAWPCYSLYWMGLALLLFGCTRLFVVRGIETGFKTRWRIAGRRLGKKSLAILISGLLIFAISGAWIYHNTVRQNKFYTVKKLRDHKAAYEQALKQYDSLLAPEIIAVRLEVDLYPDEERYELNGSYQLINPEDQPITQIFVQGNLNPKLTLKQVVFAATAARKDTFPEFKASLFHLERPVQTGDTLTMHFSMEYGLKGFAQSVPEELASTASFFTNTHLPGLGYNRANELKTDKQRARYDLAPRVREWPIDEPEGYKMGLNQAHAVDFEAVISTKEGLTATTSGQLLKSWSEKGRNYFHYKSLSPIENQFMILTGNWLHRQKPVTLSQGQASTSLFSHPGHLEHSETMIRSMAASLTYYDANFSPYPYQQLKLLEVPRAHDFAMSVPNTIAYSEALGFMNHRADSVIPFFITAHEVAHQWWGDLVRAARVKGESMIVETLSQYAAGAVTRRHLGEDALNQVLLYERGRYLRGRKREIQQEQPLALAEEQAYIHYGKGLVNMMALRHYISEDSLNNALRRFAMNFPASKKRYPNTHDLLHEIRLSTPDSMQHLVTDLFEKIIFWDARIESAHIEFTNEQYALSASINLHKYEADQAGLLHKTPIGDWVQIKVYGRNESGQEAVIYDKMQRFDESILDLRLILDQLPTRLAIDPHHALMDRNLADNVWEF